MRSIADHIYDISNNSIKAGADLIKLKIEFTEDNFIYEIKDNGCGISQENMKNIFDPFFTSRDKKIRKVGLGLPLLKQNAELTGGHVEINSIYGKGTDLKAIFNLSSFNMPEIGDIPSTISGLLSAKENIEWKLRFVYNKNKESLSTSEIKEILGNIPLGRPEVVIALKEIVKNIIEDLEKK